MSCVPKRWCTRETDRPKCAWKDAGGAGRPASFWTAGSQLQLMLAVQGHDPPQEEQCWKLSEERWFLEPQKLMDLLEQVPESPSLRESSSSLRASSAADQSSILNSGGGPPPLPPLQPGNNARTSSSQSLSSSLAN
eukprot:5824440-Pleurochrysis_carterae.AAC.1